MGSAIGPETVSPGAPSTNSNTSTTSAYSTQVFANGTAAQLAQTTNDAMVYLTCTASGTAFTLNSGPTAGVANAIIPSTPVTAGQVITYRLPAGRFLKWSATTATFAAATIETC